mmetsp:Transcript_3747/g.8349  ORF Transcript_3747/g.8349 Transcript_3747/m.8349 type:complete len:114 (-) Transcript_3747:53-394(-)
MRKANSSFLQSSLNEKEGLLNEVAVLLEAMEKRRLQLESENKQLREDLTEAATMIQEGDDSRNLLEKTVAEKDEQLSAKKIMHLWNILDDSQHVQIKEPMQKKEALQMVGSPT